jgi:hypothetical protein
MSRGAYGASAAIRLPRSMTQRPCGLHPIPRALFGIGAQRKVGNGGGAVRASLKDGPRAL